MESYSTRDVARLLGLSEAQVRSQARAGFLNPDRGPGNSYRFSFQDLVLLRTARELASARVPPRRIRRALRNLARELPCGHSLTELRLTGDGHRVMVLDEGSTWNPDSGQIQIVFSMEELPGRILLPMPPVPTRRPPDERATAAEWFELGAEMEDEAPEQARAAYTRALALEPGHADAHVNLGRMLQLEGRIQAAIEHYTRSLGAGSTDPTAAFNLGTALESLGESTKAISAYRHSLELDPNFADAHFNLARLYEQLGCRTEAIPHLRAYQQFSS